VVPKWGLLVVVGAWIPWSLGLFHQGKYHFSYCSGQGRSQTVSFGGPLEESVLQQTRGAVNGLCRTFRKRPETFLRGQAKFRGAVAPPGKTLPPPLVVVDWSVCESVVTGLKLKGL